MSCEAIETLLAIYIDDALTPIESCQVEEHLRACQSCQSLLAKLRANQAGLKSLPLVAPPSHFREELLRRVVSEGKRKKPALQYLLPRIGSLAAALLVVLLTSNLYLFPALWPTPQSVADNSGQMRIMTATPQADMSTAGAGTEKQENFAMFKAAAIAALEDNTLNDWLWSGVAAVGLFGLGAGFFVYRYRHN